ncbi:MAG: PQQ-dependent sugar dehydrogenase [Planctomycetota bacterium]|nr:PQQ-dependent sugar dehydrogenase [Planctomycetota bacterium]
MRTFNRRSQRVIPAGLVVSAILVICLSGVGCTGPASGVFGILTSVVQLILDLPNPIDVEFQADPEPTAAVGLITDRLLGRNIAPRHIFSFDAEVSAGVLGPDGSIYYATRTTGRVMSVHPETLVTGDAMVDLAVNASGQRGLKGICFSLDGTTLFVTYTASTTGADSTTESEGLENRVSSFPFAGGVVTGGETILVTGRVRDLLASDINTIGKCKIGTDGNLYYAHGDLDSRLLAQNPAPTETAGRVHRLALDGSVPGDNPTAGSSTFCLGLRHPVNFTFDSLTGALWILDEGNLISDELNLGEAGVNYGWPLIQGLNNTEAEVVASTITIGLYRNPTIDFGATTVDPSAVLVLRNSPYGTDLEGDVLIAQTTGQSQVVLWSLDADPFIFRTPLFLTALESGPIVEMVTGPNGFVFILTAIHLYRVDPA